MQKGTIFFFFFVALLVVVSPTSYTEAQTPTSTPPTTASTTAVKKAVVLATVNIQNAKILSQEKNVFAIAFDLKNREILQPKVRYAVQLIGTNPRGGKYVVDEKVYPEDILLEENATVSKEIVYTAPGSISGEYDLYVQSKSPVGIPLATVRLGKVTLVPIYVGVTIDVDSCYFNVRGEAGSPKYTLTQGVDIGEEEFLTMSCIVENFSTDEMVLTPTIETRYRSQFGNVVPVTGSTTASVTLKAKEKKMVTLELPKAELPQAYEVKVFMTSASTTTNTVSGRYIVQGIGSTVQAVMMDRDVYSAGDTAVISFVWSGSADSFNGSRAGRPSESASQYSIGLQGNTGPCAEMITSDLDHLGKVDISIPVTQECRNPKTSVSLLSATGEVLSSQELERTSPEGDQNTLAIPVAGTSVVPNSLLLWVVSLFMGGAFGAIAMFIVLSRAEASQP